MLKQLIATATVSLMAGAAFAADLPVPVYEEMPAVTPVLTSDWSGPYAGIHAGYGWGDASYDFDTAGWYNFAPGDEFSHDIEGALVGAHIGYAYQWSSLVVGIEASGTWSDIGDSATSPFFPATDEFSTEVEWYAALTPTVGVAFGNFQLYAKGGAALGEIHTDAQDFITLGGDIADEEETKFGWTVGGGGKVKLGRRWVLGVEGNYYDFGSVSVDEQARLTATGAPAGVFTDHDVDVDFFTVEGRLSILLGAR